MKNQSTGSRALPLTLVCGGVLIVANAGTDTKTTTTTHPDSTKTTTVEESTTSGDSTSQDTAPANQARQPNLIGPTGATGVIRRSDRRQDRRAGDPRLD